MARDDDEDAPWTRQLLVGAGALVAVALVIGAVVSAVALGAARVSGINDARPTASAAPTLYMPSDEPTTKPEPFPDPEGPRTSGDPSPSPDEPSGPPFDGRWGPPADVPGGPPADGPRTILRNRGNRSPTARSAPWSVGW